MSSDLEVNILGVEVVKNYINGRWVESKAKETQDVINPATGELLAKTPMSTREETLQAIVSGGITVPETVTYYKDLPNNILTNEPEPT